MIGSWRIGLRQPRECTVRRPWRLGRDDHAHGSTRPLPRSSVLS